MRGQREFVPAKAGVVPAGAPQLHRESGRCLLEESELPLPSPAPVVDTRNGSSRRQWHHRHMSSANLNRNQARRGCPGARIVDPKITRVSVPGAGPAEERRQCRGPSTWLHQLRWFTAWMRRLSRPFFLSSESRTQAISGQWGRVIAQLHGWKWSGKGTATRQTTCQTRLSE